MTYYEQDGTVMDVMIAVALDAIYNERSMAMSRDEMRIILDAALAALSDTRRTEQADEVVATPAVLAAWVVKCGSLRLERDEALARADSAEKRATEAEVAWCQLDAALDIGLDELRCGWA